MHVCDEAARESPIETTRALCHAWYVGYRADSLHVTRVRCRSPMGYEANNRHRVSESSANCVRVAKARFSIGLGSARRMKR